MVAGERAVFGQHERDFLQMHGSPAQGVYALVRFKIEAEFMTTIT